MFQYRTRYSILACIGILIFLLQIFHLAHRSRPSIVKHIRRQPCPLGHLKSTCSLAERDLSAAPHECETNLKDGALMFSRRMLASKPEILWLSLTNSSDSWGVNHFRQRNVDDFLTLVVSQYTASQVSLGMLTSSVREYNKYIEAISRYDFAKVSIVWHPGFRPSQGIDRKHRQDKEVQTARRSELAKLRNYLMLKTLDEEDHILWSDADVHKFDKGIVRHILMQSGKRNDIGLITARCSQGGNDNYDHNAWRGTRKGPREWDIDQKEIDAGELDKQGQYHVPSIIKDTDNDDLVELDVVGATILYMRASLIWQGLTFADQHVVGTRWQKDGWDGIESESLCYRARAMTGGKCAVLGGSWHVEHTKS